MSNGARVTIRLAATHKRPPARASAACADHPSLSPDAWFGDPKMPPHSTARDICMYDCPARATCLAYTLSMGHDDQPEGIFAGLTAHERRRIIRARKARRSRE